MPKFYLVRHGQTEWNANGTQQGWLDAPLTTEGIAAAEQIGRQLPADSSIIFTSDLGRAVQTAEIITRDHPEIRVLTDWRIRERGYGDLEGQPIDPAEVVKSFEDPLASYRGCEPPAIMDERIKSFIRDCALLAGDSFIVVAHNGVLSRLGHLFDETHAHTDHANSAIIEFDISYDDQRLLPQKIAAWRHAR